GDASRSSGACRCTSIFEPRGFVSNERTTLESVENGGPIGRNEAAMKYTAVVAGKSIEIEFEAKNGTVEARIGNRHYKLESSNVEPGVYWFNLDNQSIEVRVVPTGDNFTVSIGGHSLPVEIVDARNALKKAAHRGHEGMVEVRAPM